MNGNQALRWIVLITPVFEEDVFDKIEIKVE
jgi:hypothetical protein